MPKATLWDVWPPLLPKSCPAVKKIALVRCEDINISQSFMRNKFRLKNWMHKRHLTQPNKGPFHYREPRKMFWRVVRGMLPYKTAKGMAALNRMKVFEGVPPPFDKMKRAVCPPALRILRLAPGRKFCRLGDLATDIGWKHEKTVKVLEKKRKDKAVKHFKRKSQLKKIHKAATKIVDKIIPAIKYGDPNIKVGSL
mmetsp:Transcript_35054/g.58733  ORF Transcript_35054/g.58733 Transcript_35054/m.58733 type:complete len:196 (+) Transcript_35054:63-650(+)